MVIVERGRVWYKREKAGKFLIKLIDLIPNKAPKNNKPTFISRDFQTDYFLQRRTSSHLKNRKFQWSGKFKIIINQQFLNK